MKFNVAKEIKDNIVTATITVTSLGSNTLTAEQEGNLIADFPRNIEFSKINFEAPMKIGSEGLPIIASEDDVDTQTVAIDDLINQIIPIDKDLEITLSVKVSSIGNDELGDVFTSPESVAKAKISLFYLKIKEEIERLINEMRSLNDDFEKEEEFSI